MKRGVLLILLLVADVRADNAFHVDLTLKAQPNAAAKNVKAAAGPANFAGALVIRGGAQNIRVIGGRGGIIFSGDVQADSSGDSTPQVPTLRWRNGETLPGELVEASDSDLTWKSPLFDDPLQLRWGVIDRIDWPAKPEEAKDPFGIALRDGSFIYGDLVSMNADSITIKSTRHGDVVLKRAEVISVRRRQHGKLVYAGPTGDIGWQGMTNQQDGSVARNPYQPDATSPVVTGPGGALLIRSWNRSALLNITLPSSVDVEFHLHSTKRPEFLVALGGSVRSPIRVETWDNVLVLADGDQFKIIRRIEDNERDIALRVCWNQDNLQCSVFDLAGTLITTWKVQGSVPNLTPGFIVQNRGLDLSLDMLRVSAWDGRPPSKIDPKQPHIELEDGRSVSGAIASGAQGSISVQTPGQAAATNIPISNVDAVVFSSAPPQGSSRETSLLFNDGTLLFGHITSLVGAQASFATAFTNQPLSVQMNSPRQLLNLTSLPSSSPKNKVSSSSAEADESPLDGMDKIVIQDTTLHGTLGDAGDGTLGWIPVGGTRAAKTSSSLTSEITRAVPKDAPLPTDPALFYLNSGDILPGSLHSLDRSGAEFESSLMAPRKLEAAQLEAIEFSPPTRVNVQGFSDPAWKIIKGDNTSVRREGNAVVMDAGASIGLASLMQCGDFSFKYSTSGFSATRVRMFCAGKDDSNSLNVLLCSSGNQFTSGLESTAGQFDNQFQIRTQPGTPVTVRFKVENSNVELFVNDISAGEFPMDPSKCPGSGVIIEPASIWGNGVFSVSLSDFVAHSVLGRTWLPEVSADVKTQVLTLPRFEKDDPPRHLLLAANGDVLRGEIEGATDSHFGFRCGLEDLNVPRERVRAVIWLQPPSKNAATAAAATPEEQPPSNPLEDHLPLRGVFRQINLSSVIGFLRSQDQGLKIQVPDSENQRRVDQIQIGNQTVAEALTRICARFDLHYRLDPDNTIVLETPATETGGGLVSRTYWLKPDAIVDAGTSPVKDVLVAKSISFPKDASVDWRPQAGVLTMVNTENNQAKLAALIASDFGGNLGSPTHWIELTSGGRLALAVDKFGPDFILAHHPLYGAIKVPMSQVYIIRTTPPEPTTTSHTLENWQLVNAPEPVIPEGDGQSSPLLGKSAEGFTLPLLEGGDFGLTEEKGQVVVLDFWATWCGPCVKSLPGLIDTVAAFPSGRVKLIGINQGEAPDQVKHFLATRGLKLSVAMDSDQSIGRKYGVDAIPRTIIIGPDGKVAWDQTGYDPDGESAASDVIKKLLDPPSPADPPAPRAAQ